MARRELYPGVHLSTSEATPAERERMHMQLLSVLRKAHRKDVDLSDLLSAVLMELAEQLGSAEEVIVHRSGSWEADHVYRLAGGYNR